ncbi:uncharacterized protein LOC104892403 isoform X2 [Beta vulgaris subsp. vulgaris]|uniref:uncharacterized protein LOC104892403 isoform X2 n=1 Tax=Beta vulgaris subsp. vulgaris TaxID=3555 RepID=UPI002548C2C3|nr:uncharacterized protein LOC104892403 isoform X2 [Beta vulgaris subsp. vulgaris]
MLSSSITSSLYPSNLSPSPIIRFLSPPQYATLRLPRISRPNYTRNTIICCIRKNKTWVPALLTAGVALALVGPAIAANSPPLLSSIELHEPENALSLPTWAIHVSSVVEWVIAMALVWQYGEKPGKESWKGLTWGMVLVALQAALTTFGNATMCIAAFRIYKSQSHTENV